jgi:hypothetical protein
MRAPVRICRARGVAVALALGAAISLTVLTGGLVLALAEPVTTTTYAPTTAETPIVTTAAPVITTTAAPVITTTAAPVITTTAAPVITTTAAPVTTAASSPASSALVTTTAPVTTSAATSTSGSAASPTTTAGSALQSTASSAGTSQTSAAGSASTSPTSVSGTSVPRTATATSGGVSPTPTTAVQAGQTTIPTETPKTLEASPQDLQIAKASVPVQQNPDPAPQGEIQRTTTLLTNLANLSTSGAPSLAADQTSVKQFPPVTYDQFFRPVIVNPFRDPLQVVYNYAGAPRILVIPPLASAVTELAQLGAYNFTAMVLNAVGIPTSVAVGSMFGGGYLPAPGQPPPPPPPLVVKYNDVPVQVKYSNATYRPFVVHQIVDVGDDPINGGRKVLLDGITPAWGAWTQNENGERQFEVRKTQQFPGMDDPPAEGPLPGDYQLQLASASKPAPSGLSTKDVLLILAAAVVATLVLGAIVSIFRAKQHRLHRPPRANRHRGRPPSVEARVTVKVRPGSPATFETRPGDELDHDHVLAVVPVEVQRSTTVEENHP